MFLKNNSKFSKNILTQLPIPNSQKQQKMTIEFLKVPLSFVNKLEKLDYDKYEFDSECTKYCGRTDISRLDLKDLPSFF